MDSIKDTLEHARDGSSPSIIETPPAITTNGTKRKRASVESYHSPGSVARDGDVNDMNDERNRHTVKRACNQCRQQKLRCDLVLDPFQRCSRCKRLKLECRMDANFKRVGKRSKNAEMEREIVELRKLVGKDAHLGEIRPAQQVVAGVVTKSPSVAQRSRPEAADALHEGVAGSLLELRRSSHTGKIRRNAPHNPRTKSLSNTVLDPDQIDQLYAHYIHCYHPLLPVLDADNSPDYYYELSPLLFWVIMTVAARRSTDDPLLLTELSSPLSQLIWSTVSAVPQNYHVVKALCILCMWPLPTKSTSTDPSFMLCGLMMHIALQTGLHRPSHVQDFSRIRVELREGDLQDRLKTWACCNIVAQAVSTACGQPPKAVYDYTLMSLSEPGMDSQHLPANLHWRLQIERFSDKVSQKLYNNRTDPIGVTGAQERAAWISLLIEDYRNLERKLKASAESRPDTSNGELNSNHFILNTLPLDLLHLQAAGLHLRLSAFFDSPSAPNYVSDLLELYFATTTFLKSMLALESQNELPGLQYATSYLMQMTLVGGFTLMKLLNSFFAHHIDAAASRRLFTDTIWAIRKISVRTNDLPSRLAEVLAQLWRSYGAGGRGSIMTGGSFVMSGGLTVNEETGSAAFANVTSGPGFTGGPGALVDSSLQLKVRCRMSMSLVFDSVWRWREEFQFKSDSGADQDTAGLALDSAVNDPTNPELDANGERLKSCSATARNTPGVNARSTPGLSPGIVDCGMAVVNSLSNGLNSEMGTNATLSLNPMNTAEPPSTVYTAVGEYNYEVFDPLTWMLDGTGDFPFSLDGGSAALTLGLDRDKGTYGYG